MDSFSRKVYDVVKRIPRGKVMSYKQVAKAAGSPGAFRAVGNAMNKNPDLKSIPCHRVIKSDRSVGGYRLGTKIKISLLKREGVVVKEGRVVL